MIDAVVRSRIERFWAGEFGCSIAALETPGLRVLVRADPDSAFVFRRGDCCIWHVPERFRAAVARSLAGQDSVERVFQPAFIAALFGSAVQVILGPCPIAYFPETKLQLVASLPECRRLTEGDRAAVELLAADCGPVDWDHGGVEFDGHRSVFGCFADGRLVSAASYEIWGAAIAHVGVATAPAYRGRGFATSVATAATIDALRRGLVPQWRTLESNFASIRVGEAIGYVPFAAHFVVRLAPE
ncbi:MAG TPA: GNAT family N-acetyltransferase [Pirellulales bacterium]|jgi:RimJ/RimL family protein N-acetyltransferase